MGARTYRDIALSAEFEDGDGYRVFIWETGGVTEERFKSLMEQISQVFGEPKEEEWCLDEAAGREITTTRNPDGSFMVRATFSKKKS